MPRTRKARNGEAPVSHVARAVVVITLAGTLAWAGCGFWNAVKPLPPGIHVASLPERLGESQIDLLGGDDATRDVLAREAGAIALADQTIIIDQSPLPRRLADLLLVRKRQHPNLKILLVTDPRNSVYGGTRVQTLSALERAGIVVARVRLERLRDSNPMFSSLWRLTLQWWSNPFDEAPGATWMSALRQQNGKADERQLLVADDGAGGWTAIVASGPVRTEAIANPAIALEIRGHLARDIAASELRVADWSTQDDRLPAAPPVEGRGVGTIDARFLTEGAIGSALREVIALAGRGDSIDLLARALDDRGLVDTVARAARLGARVRVLLDAGQPGSQAAAGELVRHGGGNVELRWRAPGETSARFALIRHLNDVWLEVGSADFTRRCLGDSTLEADLELHLPARAAAARAAADVFEVIWPTAAAYATHADESPETYWRYRVASLTGLAVF